MGRQCRSASASFEVTKSPIDQHHELRKRGFQTTRQHYMVLNRQIRSCDGLILERWSRLAGQNGGLAKVDFGFDYAANLSSFACVA